MHSFLFRFGGNPALENYMHCFLLECTQSAYSSLYISLYIQSLYVSLSCSDLAGTQLQRTICILSCQSAYRVHIGLCAYLSLCAHRERDMSAYTRAHTECIQRAMCTRAHRTICTNSCAYAREHILENIYWRTYAREHMLENIYQRIYTREHILENKHQRTYTREHVLENIYERKYTREHILKNYMHSKQCYAVHTSYTLK